MLVLQRKKHEDIIIGDDIHIKILRIDPYTVRIGITAPQSISVHRAEVYEKINQAPQLSQPVKITVKPKKRYRKAA